LSFREETVMRLFVPAILLTCIWIAGCEVSKQNKPVSGSDIQQALQTASVSLNDSRALMPKWYRNRCHPAYWTSTTTETKGIPGVLYSTHVTSTAVPWINPIPLWRLFAICAIFFPFLIAIAINPFNDKVQDQILGIAYRPAGQVAWNGCCLSFGLGMTAVAVPFVLCWPVYGISCALGFGLTGESCYVPWHFAAFAAMGLMLLGLSMATVRPLVGMTRTGVSVSGVMGVVGIVLQLIGFAFTIRDLFSLAIPK